MAPKLRVHLLDRAGKGGWRELLAERATELPTLDPRAPASLLYTSGTTGAPKGVPLSHGNILSNLNGLLDARMAGPRDRVLLPLPLHHAYAFTVGCLGCLASGATLVLPAGISGPEIVRALQLQQVTMVIGVPRLYESILAGIRARVASQGRRIAVWFERLLALSLWLRRALGVRVGRVLFRALHRSLGGGLRVLASGGAQLDPELAWDLEGLGWEVLTGYGLTETAPMVSFNRHGQTRLGSAGQAVPGVELRIALRSGFDDGEIEVKGPNVFAGYRNNPEATRAAFTEDGWFRTGDLGRIDAQGFLTIVGRSKEMIVLPDGKNVFPEAVEAVYSDSPFLHEAAVLEHEGLLVLLVVPEDEAIRAHGAARPEALLREEIDRLSRRLAPYQRASGFAITRDPLPRTPLSKLKRHLLPALYSRATAGVAPSPASTLFETDRALLADPTARPVWDWLRNRYPDRRLSLDTSPQLDLGLDSLAWVGLSLEMEQRFGIDLTEAAISRVVTLRDLLIEVTSARSTGAAAAPALELTPEQQRWLRPTGILLTALGLVVYGLNRAIFRGLFRLRVEGANRVPARASIVLVPNHLSHLDAFVLAAALPWRRLRHTYWAGWTGALFTGPATRLFSRIAQVLPVDPDRSPGAALALAQEVLTRGEALVWFPEGRRSPDGTLQPFQPGIGHVLTQSRAASLPVLIRGTSEALPVGRRTPRLTPLSVRFGAAISFDELRSQAVDPADLADLLHDAVAALSPSPPDPSSGPENPEDP
jgi:long-chain acyl-CoA synthetase